MNIVLTGYMGSGKTTVGTRIAELLDMKFTDSDAEIEKQCEMPISKIFEVSGEEYFRSVEAEVIKKLARLDGFVIATGGGVVLNTENIAVLRENGVIINLETSEAVIRARFCGEDPTRPLVKDRPMAEIIERFNGRKPYYDNCNIKIKLTPEKGIEDVAKEILEILEEKYGSKIRSGR